MSESRKQAIELLKNVGEKFVIRPDYVSCRPGELQATMSMDLANELICKLGEALALLESEPEENERLKEKLRKYMAKEAGISCQIAEKLEKITGEKNVWKAIKQLQAELVKANEGIEELRKAINRAITILPVAKMSYVMDELEQALRA